jgi:hypothetical protein
MTDTLTPGYASPSPGGFLKEVGMDGKKWTDAFMQIWGHRLNEADHDTMLGWFYNAIMAGYDECARRQVERGDDIDAFLIRLGMPHVKTAFPGTGNPTKEQMAHEIGKSLIQLHLGLCEEISMEEIDGDIEPVNIHDIVGKPTP